MTGVFLLDSRRIQNQYSRFYKFFIKYLRADSFPSPNLTQLETLPIRHFCVLNQNSEFKSVFQILFLHIYIEADSVKNKFFYHIYIQYFQIQIPFCRFAKFPGEQGKQIPQHDQCPITIEPTTQVSFCHKLNFLLCVIHSQKTTSPF